MVFQSRGGGPRGKFYDFGCRPHDGLRRASRSVL